MLFNIKGFVTAMTKRALWFRPRRGCWTIDSVRHQEECG
jgi:hypothetical protein